MLIPTVLIAIILPAFSYLWFTFGWGTINYVNFDMNFAPNAISAFMMSGGDFRNVILVCINLLIAAVIWFPFFKAADIPAVTGVHDDFHGDHVDVFFRFTHSAKSPV